MIYLDSNVFIYGVLYEDKKAESARALLQEVALGRRQATTSVLALDEALWIIWKEKKDRAYALQRIRAFMRFTGLSIISTTEETFSKALELLETHTFLKPRDGIHAATAVLEGITTIVSDDADFDKIPPLRRVPLEGSVHLSK